MKQPLPSRDDLLTRDETAVALTAAGYPIRSATLGTKATRGGGPSFRRFGTRSLYRWGDALDILPALITPRASDIITGATNRSLLDLRLCAQASI
jgi:hypothetical protein